MLWGLTYDLRSDYLAAGYGEEETAEFDRPDTINAIERALTSLGHRVERIGNAKSLTEKICAGRRWDMVFNIAEGLHGIGREAQVPALLDLYEIPYTFSDPLVMAISLHKAMAKRVVRDLGIPTPAFALIAEEADLADVNLPYPLFAKPVAEGTGKGVGSWSKIEDDASLREVCARLLRKFRQPVLLETYLPGREFTVGIIGTGREAEALGTIEVLLKNGAEEHAYSYINKERCEELVQYRLVNDAMAEAAAATALAVWRGLGCRDAGRVDLRADAKGVPNFLEVNPIAGLHPEHSDLPIICSLRGIAYQELIRRIAVSALKRRKRAVGLEGA